MYYSIGAFAALTGLSVHTLRYYEQEHLLEPERSASNRRRYTDRDLAWVAFLKRLKATGMPIKEIQRYAAFRQAGASTVPERLNLLVAHCRALDAQIAQLQEHRDRLDEKIDFYRQLIPPIREEEDGTAL